jgi:hypothetical protein
MHLHYATYGAAVARPHEAPAVRVLRLSGTVELAAAHGCDDHIEHLQRMLDQQLDELPAPAPDQVPLAAGSPDRSPRTTP